jgi:16S rRNA (guanine966-N2)-methyltransferase
LVLDAFAGTGALGLEALSRGAARAVFFERDRAALGVLRLNIAACRAEAMSVVVAGDATRSPRPGVACGLVFLDPPYGQGLIAAAFPALCAAGWVAPGAVVVGEYGAGEEPPELGEVLATRRHGAAKISVWRVAAASGAGGRP